MTKPVGYWQGEFSEQGGATLYEVPQESCFNIIYPNLPLYDHPKQEMTEARARDILENEFGGDADNCHVLGFQYSIEVMKAYIFWVERKSEQPTGISG